ncbi:positive regulator of sigma E activity [Bradyrhizobium japonicum]
MSEHEREHPSVVGQNGAVGLVIDAVLGVVSLMMLLPLVFLMCRSRLHQNEQMGG